MTEIAYSHIRACSLICVRLFATLWTAAYQAPLSVGFSRQEYWSGLLLPPPGDLPNSGIELASQAPPALRLNSLTTVPTRKAKCLYFGLKSNKPTCDFRAGKF